MSLFTLFMYVNIYYYFYWRRVSIFDFIKQKDSALQDTFLLFDFWNIMYDVWSSLSLVSSIVLIY